MGEEITISRAGKRVAKLVTYLGAPVRAPWILSGKIRIDDNFDAHHKGIAELSRAE